MIFLWHGTAAVELRCAEGRILFDPYVTPPGAQFPSRLEDFDAFADIFITHGHFDHIASIPQIAERNPRTRIHGTDAPLRTLSRLGVPAGNLARIAPGETRRVQGFAVTALAGKHAALDSVTPQRVLKVLSAPTRRNLPALLRAHLRCREEGETLFYRIAAEGKTIGLMGSLNLRGDVDYPTGLDALVLAYNGWADNCAQAERVIGRLKPRRVLLTHWDDAFPPFTQPLDLTPILRKYPERVEAPAVGLGVLI